MFGRRTYISLKYDHEHIVLSDLASFRSAHEEPGNEVILPVLFLLLAGTVGHFGVSLWMMTCCT